MAVALLMTAPRSQARETPLQHARHVIAFFDRHRAAAATPPGQHALWNAIHVLSTAVRSLQSASIYPPHHRLWTCIHSHEASSWSAVNPNGHYGGLQMTWGWLGYLNGNPAALTQAQQEWAAERAWAASGYSYAFLVSQWYAYDAAGVCGTTG
jgi:hypothetical protein